jgi:uncharacterized protein YbaR (Trm112 family)/SAM-dependent methyltransferase
MSLATAPSTMTAPVKPESPVAPLVRSVLACPVCKLPLEWAEEHCHCTNEACQAKFPLVDGIPILINEPNSLFRIEDYLQHTKTYFSPQSNQSRKSLRKRFMNWLVPTIDHNIKSQRNFAKFAEHLRQANPNQIPTVLIIGASVLGKGLQALQDSGQVRFVETDVSFSSRVKVICDGHDLPFAENAFDGVIVQAVLEHVVDPFRCVEEIHRVLKPTGLVYAETPFMQQVHGAAYDFLRFSHLGHRRLFRRFSELESGVACGPAMALTWSYKYFLNSFLTRRTPNILRTCVNIFANLSCFWIKYFDYFLIDKPGSLDAASGYYFIGRKSTETLSDRELVKQYRGCL